MNTLCFPALRRLAALAVLGLLLTVGVTRSYAQITVYARFANGTGVWVGESTDAGRTGWVNLRSVTFGSAINVSFSGGGATVSPPTFDNVVLTKAVDRLTPQIFAALTPGVPINGGPGVADVTIEFVINGAAGPVTFFRVELRRVYFTEQKNAGSGGDDLVLETVTLKNVAFRYTHWVIQPNGSQGASTTSSWSTATNQPTFTP